MRKLVTRAMAVAGIVGACLGAPVGVGTAAAQQMPYICPETGEPAETLVCYYDRDTHRLLYCRIEC